MDRLSTGLESARGINGGDDGPRLFFESAGKAAEDASKRLALPDKLFGLEQLDVLYDPAAEVLWTYMRPSGRPSFTPRMLADFEEWQRLILEAFGEGGACLQFLVLGSRARCAV